MTDKTSSNRNILVKLIYQKPGYGVTILHAKDMADYLIANNIAVQKQGEWVDKPTGAYGRWQSWCSACGKHSGIGGIKSNRHKPYCPNCGAKMVKEDTNAER